MIGIVGYMSGGKTLTAVEIMMNKIAEGHIVCSNIILNCKGVTGYLNIPCVYWKQLYIQLTDNIGYNRIKEEDYYLYPIGTPRGSKDYNDRLVYIFLDEVSSVFDSITNSASSEIKRIAVWARHTEKRGQIVYLIMQFTSELHKRLRNHLTEIISCQNSSTMRLPIIHTKLPFFLRGYIVRTLYSGDGETVITNAKWSSIDTRLYTCYNTGQIVYGNLTGKSYKFIKYKKKEFNPWLKRLLLILVLGDIIFFLFSWLLF